MAQFEGKEVMQMLASAQKRPDNRISVKFKGMILAVEEYQRKDLTLGRKYKIWQEATGDIVTFTSPRLLKKGELAEVMLTLSGFSAFEAK